MEKILTEFGLHLWHYTKDIVPILTVGFLLSGVLHELIPEETAEKFINRKGVWALLIITLVGILLPVCCIGCLPIAVGLKRKGVRLGPILSFLVATPATSISAILMTLKFFGPMFTIYLCLSVIILGLAIGLIGNTIKYTQQEKLPEDHSMSESLEFFKQFIPKKTLKQKIGSMFKYAFIDLPKEIGIEITVGVLLAVVINTFAPIQYIIKNFLSGFYGYLFSVIFGLIMYICSTASVPLVFAFYQQGLNIDASLVLLILGPVTSYGTLLVIRKEFGYKILLLYLSSVTIISVLCGLFYGIIIK